MNAVDPERVFRIIALILSNRGDGFKVTVKEVKKISPEMTSCKNEGGQTA